MTQEMALFLGCWLQVWYLLASFVTVRLQPPVPLRSAPLSRSPC